MVAVSLDRKSTRLNSSHDSISYAVFCLKKTTRTRTRHSGRTHRVRPHQTQARAHADPDCPNPYTQAPEPRTYPRLPPPLFFFLKEGAPPESPPFPPPAALPS